VEQHGGGQHDKRQAGQTSWLGHETRGARHNDRSSTTVIARSAVLYLQSLLSVETRPWTMSERASISPLCPPVSSRSALHP
jgi:hypothetical protein